MWCPQNWPIWWPLNLVINLFGALLIWWFCYKLEICVRVWDFFFSTFEHFYIVIWSCMLFKDVLEILPLLMPKTFIDQFVCVWGCAQCTTTTCWFTHLVYYYLKDLNWVHLACRGLPYGDKNQTLFIDDEPNKALRNPKWSKLFL